jgi:hypothetical protein
MNCQSCGTPRRGIDGEANFCTACGARFSAIPNDPSDDPAADVRLAEAVAAHMELHGVDWTTAFRAVNRAKPSLTASYVARPYHNAPETRPPRGAETATFAGPGI